MQDSTGRAHLRRLVEELRADPETLEGVVQAARTQSSAVAQLPVQEVRRHIAPMLETVAAAVVDAGDLSADLVAADRLANDRALQGVPLAALLDGFQAGRGYVMTKLIEGAREGGVPTEIVLNFLVELDAFANELQKRMINTYRETERSLARTARAARTQALRALLHDEPAAGPADAGLEPAKRYHILVADVTDPAQARQLEGVLAGPDGVCGLVDGYLCGAAARLPAEAAVAGVLVIATPAVPGGELADAYRLCRAALVPARQRRMRGLRPLTSLAAVVAMAAQPRLATMLADELLAALDRADEFHRLLAETALAYLEHGSRVDLAAVALHVHPNTVKHRLRRLAELTAFDDAGSPCDSLAHAVHWWWSLRTWLDRPSR